MSYIDSGHMSGILKIELHYYSVNIFQLLWGWLSVIAWCHLLYVSNIVTFYFDLSDPSYVSWHFISEYIVDNYLFNGVSLFWPKVKLHSNKRLSTSIWYHKLRTSIQLQTTMRVLHEGYSRKLDVHVFIFIIKTTNMLERAK